MHAWQEEASLKVILSPPLAEMKQKIGNLRNLRPSPFLRCPLHQGGWINR